jgi:small subunit ribosomal protein S21
MFLKRNGMMGLIGGLPGGVRNFGLTLFVNHLWYQYLLCVAQEILGHLAIQDLDGRFSETPSQRTGILVELGGVVRLAEVKLQEGETLENALRRFKRKVQQEDIIKEVKRHSFYLKPGEKLRAKQALARKRNRKKSRREME